MKKFIEIILLSFLFLFMHCTNSNSLNTDTHMLINQYVARNTLHNFFLGSYLKDQLGFQNQIDETVVSLNGTSLKVYEWIQYGGEYEDKPPQNIIPYRRSRNHFHNPLLPWNQAGYTGTLSFCAIGQCPVSAILWAQGPQSSSWLNPGGDWSWQMTRLNFFKALTASTKSDKDSSFADTFRGIGQVMHLLEDMSVPEHTRNEFHPFGLYEDWVSGHVNDNRIPISFYTPNDSQFFAGQVNGISSFFDTDQYTGSNPAITNSNTVGLSEYTNANFFSFRTIFKSGFPYPAVSSVVENPVTDSKGNRKIYLKKLGDGETIDHIALASEYYKYLPSDLKRIAVTTDDDLVYNDYAQKLLPRAIGYSSGLLNYFFRGELGVHHVIPIFKDNVLDALVVKIRNYSSTKETMKNGYFGLAYQYTAGDGSMAYGSIPYVFGMNDAGVAELPYGKNEDGTDNDVADLEIKFTSFPTNISVADYPSVKFTIAYFGDLGVEIRDKTGDSGNAIAFGGAVIGKVFQGGDILFNEDWDKGLTGNYQWCHGVNVPEGTTGITNIPSNGELIKDSVNGNCEERLNESLVSSFYYFQYGCHDDKMPIAITKDTYLEFKIDALTINNPPTNSDGSKAHFQTLWISFGNGTSLQFSLPGQFVGYPDTGYFVFTTGAHMYANVYELLKQAGLAITEPLTLTDVDIVQQVARHDSNYGDCSQHMEMDYVRVVDAKPKDPQ